MALRVFRFKFQKTSLTFTPRGNNARRFLYKYGIRIIETPSLANWHYSSRIFSNKLYLLSASTTFYIISIRLFIVKSGLYTFQN